MNYQNIRQAKAIEKANKEKLLKINSKLDDESGLYFLTRVDNNDFKYAYVGQAKHILTRLAQHMVGYQQHIDLSLKKHKFYSEDNPYGWKINFIHLDECDLDEWEKRYIKVYADSGYQLRNVSLGGQGEGRNMINEIKPPKTYRQGIQQGRKNLAKELSSIIDKHLTIAVKEEKKGNKVSERMLEKFNSLINEDSYKESD